MKRVLSIISGILGIVFAIITICTLPLILIYTMGVPNIIVPIIVLSSIGIIFSSIMLLKHKGSRALEVRCLAMLPIVEIIAVLLYSNNFNKLSSTVLIICTISLLFSLVGFMRKNYSGYIHDVISYGIFIINLFVVIVYAPIYIILITLVLALMYISLIAIRIPNAKAIEVKSIAKQN